MIQLELNGKTRLISIEEFLERDIQDILADDIGVDIDPLVDFEQEAELPPFITPDEDN